MSAADIFEFEPEHHLPDDAFQILVFGPRRSGKTSWLRSFCMQLLKADRITEDTLVYFISGTAESTDPKNVDFVPPSYLFSDMTRIEEYCSKLIQMQEGKGIGPIPEGKSDAQVGQVIDMDNSFGTKYQGDRDGDTIFSKDQLKKARKRKQRIDDEQVSDSEGDGDDDTPAKEKHPVLLIFDDAVSEDNIRHSPSLRKLANNGRHYNISVIILGQNYRGSGSVPPTVRNNQDLIVNMTIPDSRAERDMMANEYLTPSDDRAVQEQGREIWRDVAQIEFRAFIIAKHMKPKRTYADYVFKSGPAQADSDGVVEPTLKIGTKKQWRLSNGEDDESRSKAAGKKRKKNNSSETSGSAHGAAHGTAHGTYFHVKRRGRKHTAGPNVESDAETIYMRSDGLFIAQRRGEFPVTQTRKLNRQDKISKAAQSPLLGPVPGALKRYVDPNSEVRRIFQ